MPSRQRAAAVQSSTPVQVIARGMVAGLAATLLLSALSLAVPGLWNEGGDTEGDGKPKLPEDPFDPQQVRKWQERSQAPARRTVPSPPGAAGWAACSLPTIRWRST